MSKIEQALVMIVPSGYMQHPSVMEEFQIDRYGDMYDKELDIWWLYGGNMHGHHVFVVDPAKL